MDKHQTIDEAVGQKVNVDAIVGKFPWGLVVATHSVGEYLIVEYRPRIYKDGHGTKKFEPETTHFHPYWNGSDTNVSYLSLDQALIGVICRKADGCNSRADGYIFAMIGI